MSTTKDVAPMPKTPWHAWETQRVLAYLDTHETHGLSQEEAATRLRETGPNVLSESNQRTALSVFLEQLSSILVIILIIAAGLSAALGHVVEATTIGIIVLFSVLLGFFQEYRSERALEALRKLASPTSTVLRGGEEMEVASETLVPGDIIILSTGDTIPADARLLEAISLQADESLLTGESVAAEKRADGPVAASALPGDRENMIFVGTTVTRGRGRAVVTGTGMATEFGHIAGMLQNMKAMQTPLQQQLDRLGRLFGIVAICITLTITFLGLLRGDALLDVFLFGIALAVAVVPEALPAVVTISLAIGVQRMAKRNALVRQLAAVETLGSTTVICTDKTGTLTRDEMTVRRIVTAEGAVDVSGSGYEPKGTFSSEGRDIEPSDVLLDALRGAVLASDARLIEGENGWAVRGDPTEGGLVVAATKAGLSREILDEQFPRLAEIPFSSETKRMTTLHRSGEGNVAYSKGAFEVLIGSCTYVRTTEGIVPLQASQRENFLHHAHDMASRSLRVLAVASKQHTTLEVAEEGMTFLGLVGMIDPPRPEAAESVRVCSRAGIRVVMVTGDHPSTAEAIARELGIDGERVVTGQELSEMGDEELRMNIERIGVYARVSPEHKLRIVTALQERGHTVAMTGDGVNDAPALKRANVGIAMGRSGTDVSREAAAITLTDDNFASIVAAVEEGRGIYTNIRKYLMYLLSSNAGEVLLMAASTLLGLPLPLTAVQILYVNLATDGFPALALAVDPRESDLMTRRPRRTGQGILTRSSAALLIAGGMWTGLVNVGLFAWLLRSGRSLETAMTMTFATLIIIQFINAYIFRSERHNLFRGLLRNHWLNLAIIVEMLMLFALFYVPLLQRAFSTVPLDLREWLFVLTTSLTIIPVLEAVKFLSRRGTFGSFE